MGPQLKRSVCEFCEYVRTLVRREKPNCGPAGTVAGSLLLNARALRLTAAPSLERRHNPSPPPPTTTPSSASLTARDCCGRHDQWEVWSLCSLKSRCLSSLRASSAEQLPRLQSASSFSHSQRVVAVRGTVPLAELTRWNLFAHNLPELHTYVHIPSIPVSFPSRLPA